MAEAGAQSSNLQALVDLRGKESNTHPCQQEGCRLANPFERQSSQSCYLGLSDGELVRLRHDGAVSNEWRHIDLQFRSIIGSPQYSCVGAKSAVRTASYRIGFYGSLSDMGFGLMHDLFEFAAEQPHIPGLSTFVAAYNDPPFPATPEIFHEQLFLQLEHLAAHDPCAWDETVSENPLDPAFEFSFAGTAWFVVGMHPGATRVARRFMCPLLVFNSHRQFEDLRKTGRYMQMQRAIRTREASLQPDGTINPMLHESGLAPAWRQFSGVELDDSAMCPFLADSPKQRPIQFNSL